MTTSPHITELRQHLLDTLADLRNREKPMEPDRARAVAQVASVLVDSAKVEVDYLRATGQDRAAFLAESPGQAAAQLGGTPTGRTETRAGSNGIATITRHTLRG